MQHQILLVWCLTALSLIFSAVTGSYSSYFRAGYLKDSSFIIKQEPPAWTETQIVCASRCLIYIKRILNRCNAYQYDLDTKMCTLLVVPSVMIDTDSGDGIKVMLSDQVVSVPSEKLKRNMRAFWTFTADKTIGRLDLTVYGSTISDSGSMDEFFKDNEYALQLQNTYGTINPKKGALTVKGESLTVCLWFKDYDLKTDDIFLTWKYNYRRALGQCKRSRWQCDNPLFGCTGLCTTNCGHKACVLGVCTCPADMRNRCEYIYYYYESCYMDVPSYGIQFGKRNGLYGELLSDDNKPRSEQKSNSKTFKNDYDWHFYCMVLTPDGNMKFYQDGKLQSTSMGDGYQKNVNSYNDISAMTDEVLYIGRLPLDIARTPFDPDITSMNGALAYLQIYIGEEMLQEDIIEAMKLTSITFDP